MTQSKKVTKGVMALSPLGVFVVLYLITSIIAGDFYKVPLTVAFMLASVYAVMISTGRPMSQRISAFSRGASSEQMMLMIWIFVLAGAFASSAKAMGSIDATVNLTLSLLPPQMLLAGLFLAACFISLSIGTSVGTIVALTPIASGLADETGTSLAMMAAVVVGGSFFGDNLSFISDTTIAATSTQGCRLSDKFRVNSFIVVPAAIVVLCVYLFLGAGVHAPAAIDSVELVKVIPYLAVLVCAIFGINVMVVLVLGIVLTGLIGLVTGMYDVFGWFKSMGDGIMGMGELIIVTMMAGGMLELIKRGGGIDYIMGHLTRRVNGKRGAELAIGALVAVVDLCTANNTVAIITVGGIAHQIGSRYGVDSRKAASILDTFSCFTQGLLPYGAQMLMAAGLAQLSPVAMLPYLYYPFAIGIAAMLSILLRYPRRYS
ncbi:MAG: Na+/H+ antiporter NhaC family protein [Prevotella sp.]|nr:Na+/H+ antiporter NhaC family protein [Prevotella sp.]